MKLVLATYRLCGRGFQASPGCCSLTRFVRSSGRSCRGAGLESAGRRLTVTNLRWSQSAASRPLPQTPHRTGSFAAAKLLQLCPTLCDPTDGSPPGSPISGILQAGTLEWVAISFSNARKWKVKVKPLSRVWLSATPWTPYEAPPMGFSRQAYWSGVPLPSPTGSFASLLPRLQWDTGGLDPSHHFYPVLPRSGLGSTGELLGYFILFYYYFCVMQDLNSQAPCSWI